MYEVPLPTTVGGSQIKKDRVSGPPSKMYPMIRDLGEADAKVTIEVDTEKHRYTGTAMMIGDRPGASQVLYLREESTELARRSAPRPIKLTDIIAFRVLSIEVEKLPAIL